MLYLQFFSEQNKMTNFYYNFYGSFMLPRVIKILLRVLEIQTI